MPRHPHITVLTCLRCKHQWYPREPRLPATCASKKCKSPYWNKPRVFSEGANGFNGPLMAAKKEGR